MSRKLHNIHRKGRKMDIQIAETALKKVAERNGVPLEMVLDDIRAAIQQSELKKIETERGRTITPEEAVALLGDAVLEARQQKANVL